MSPELLLEIFKKTLPQFEVTKWKKVNLKTSPVQVLEVTIDEKEYVFNYVHRELWSFAPKSAFNRKHFITNRK